MQRSRKGNAYDFSLSAHAGIAERHRLQAGTHFILSSEQNPVYARVSGSGGQPLTAKKRLNLYDAAYSYRGFISAGVSAAAAVAGGKCVEQRLCFEARCVW